MKHSTVILAGMALAMLFSVRAAGAPPLSICATTPDLASIAREIGGGHARVTAFAKGTESAHFVEARPSFIKQLAAADLYLQTGLDLEAGWAPVLLAGCRNARVQPGATGFLDASEAIIPLEVPTGTVDRSMGDVHPLGNPHYLLDPIRGLAVARVLADRLSLLRPEAGGDFQANFERFEQAVLESLFGARLLAHYGPADAAKLAVLLASGRLAAFLSEQGQTEMLGGWAATLQPHRGARAIADHREWAYFAARFGISIVAHLEPKPGITPSTGHLRRLIAEMREAEVALILTSPYFDPRHARLVAEHTGARIVAGAHNVGARPNTESYIEMIDHNVRAVAAALRP